MKNSIAAVLITLTLTGCATTSSLVDGLLGRYHNYDPVEYGQTVHLVLQARALESACQDPNMFKYKLHSMDSTADQLQAYTEGRPYNKRMLEVTDALIGMIQDTVKKDSMSDFFCRQRAKNIVKAAETIRTLSGDKPE